MKRLVLVLILLCLGASVSGSEESVIPNIVFEVPVRQKENGELGKAIHILELNCIDGQCRLKTISFNNCMFVDSREGGLQVIRADSRSTKDNNLVVRREGNALVVEGRSGFPGDLGFHHRFEFDPNYSDLPRLIDFSGGYIVHSRLLEKMITGEFVAVRGGLQEIEVDCPILIRGLP